MSGKINNEVSSEPLRLALFGQPLTHSLSPILHQTHAEWLGRPLSYHCLPSSAEGLDEALREAERLGVVGANVTAPHKALAATRCHTLTPRAQRLGVVNTLTWSEGRIEGHNTDVDGVMLTLKELMGEGLEGANLRLIGAGGAARAVAWAALELGVGSLEVVARREEQAQALCVWLNEHSSAMSAHPVTLRALSVEETRSVTRGVTRGETPLVTCLSTPPLDEGTLSDLLGEGGERAGAALFDLNYGARAAHTLAWCEARNIKALDGTLMLAEQGRRSFERWTDALPPLELSVGSLRGAH